MVEELLKEERECFKKREREKIVTLTDGTRRERGERDLLVRG